MEITSDFYHDLRGAIRRLEKGEHIAGGELAALVSSIAGYEMEEGGPYASSGGVADVGFNLFIAYFLALCGASLPRLDAFLDAGLCGSCSAFATADEMREVALRWQSLRRKKEGDVKRYSPEEERMMDMIMDAAEKRFEKIPSELGKLSREGILKTIRGNRDKQMPLMPYYMRQALGAKAVSIDDKSVAEMGLANIFFWTAFISYDDFWDEDEAADPRMLPSANLFARSYVKFFDSILPPASGFRSFFHELMDGLDGANTWETVCCRAEVRGSKFIIPERLPEYGDYENKFLPSAGHILGPVAMLVKLGYAIDSDEVGNLVSYFRNYLIAMQINDDAHDWEEDMRRGHLSTVVVMLLRDLGRKNGEIDLDADSVELKKIFWFKTIAGAAETAILHAERSRRALRSLTMLEDPAPLERFIDITENVARKTLAQQEDSMDFLTAYKQRSGIG